MNGQLSIVDQDAANRAKARLDDLTKPIGSLGIWETIIVRLAGMTGKTIPQFQKPTALLFAADHGISARGVSAYGSEVTEEMVVNMCMGSAVSSVLARMHGVDLKVIDVGIRSRVRHPNVIARKIAPGTRDFSEEPAMTSEQARQSVETGFTVTEEAIRGGADFVVVGEMGIGNTSASTAVLAALLQLPVEQLVGLGTGITDDRKRAKAELISKALVRHRPMIHNPYDVLEKVGGFEIGAMAGSMLACAKHRVPVLLDGVITGAAALLAQRISSSVGDFLIASHCSTEPAHSYVLQALGLQELVQWGMHLGEGSGALMVLPALLGACKVMAETATFDDARVTNPHKRTESPALDPQTSIPSPVALDFTEEERKAVYKAILARRDIRSFLPAPIPEDVLKRILAAAHHGPSVGYMQPWNFILIRDKQVLTSIQTVVERERVRASENYQDLKQDYYLRLKVEGLLQAPLTICVTNDPSRGGPHVLGRNTIPETDLMSTSCAIENMWLAARAEGVGLGWVSIYQKQDIREILGIPEPVEPVALLSVGYTAHFPDIPLLERVGWGKRINLETLVYQNQWGIQEG